MALETRFPLSAYAYELIVGDVVDGRTVTGVADPDRPNTPGAPRGPGTVTITYTEGDPDELDRMASVSLTRDAAAVLARLNPAYEDGEA